MFKHISIEGGKIMEKKAYVKPELTIHGDVEKITLNGNLQFSDLPNGPNNTANCPAGGVPGVCS